MKMQYRAPLHLLMIMAVIFSTAVISAQHLVIQDGSREIALESRVLEGHDYYRVDQLSAALGFRMNDSGANLEVVGDRGSLTVISGRPLVRSGSQYILLSSPVVKLRSEGWWVPEDFLEKALPNIISRTLVATGNNSYRIEALNENVVRVDTVDYPDRVSVVFRTSRQVSPRIREFREYIEIRFDEYIVDLEEIRNPSTIDVVKSIEFDPTDGLGTFRVDKGEFYGRYREYELTDPPRVVIEFFEEPRERAASQPSAPAVSQQPEAFPPSVDGEEAGALPGSREIREEVVVIDPGHGGPDSGAEAGSRILEKNLTLAVAKLLEAQLEAKGIQTRITRNRDTYLTPEQRSAVANFYSTRAFVSLHLGASPSPATQGPVVYVHKPYLGEPEAGEAAGEEGGSGQEDRVSGSPGNALLVPWEEGQNPWIEKSVSLAGTLQESLNSVFLSENRVLEVPISLLEPVMAPAVMIEFGFLTNALDREFLLTEGFQDEIARLIADGIVEFLR